MANNTQLFETRILLNSEEAKNKLAALKKQLDNLHSKRSELNKANDTKGLKELQKEINKVEKDFRVLETRQQSINRSLENLSTAKPKELKHTIKAINSLLNDGSVERGSKQWDALQTSLRKVKAELNSIKEESNINKNLLNQRTYLFRFVSLIKNSICSIYQHLKTNKK